MQRDQAIELLQQALEHKRGEVEIYDAAVDCATTAYMRAEWKQRREQTQVHVRVMLAVLESLSVEPGETRGTRLVRTKNDTLIQAMHEARAVYGGDRAERVATHCIGLAETKDRCFRESIGRCATALVGVEAVVLQEAYLELEEDAAPRPNFIWAPSVDAAPARFTAEL